MTIAVTGAGGRLGSAIVRALAGAGVVTNGHAAWPRADFDLDAPEQVGALLDAVSPDLVIHAAAWTDVDGCALDPELALRRNGHATGVLAAAATTRGIDLILISTNEVFDGERHGRPYGPSDSPSPANAYGASKLAGEHAATEAYRDGARGTLGIVRTAWLFGPGRPDFPAKVIAAARRAAEAGEPMRLVSDEVGTPTSVDDVAQAIVEMVGGGAFGGISHLVNGGTASRAEWGRDVLRRLDLGVPVVEVSLAEFPRPSRPPRWGVLEATPMAGGRVMRHWTDAMADYVPALRQSVATT